MHKSCIWQEISIISAHKVSREAIVCTQERHGTIKLSLNIQIYVLFEAPTHEKKLNTAVAVETIDLPECMIWY